MDEERWAPIPEFPYEVSDMGRVRRTGRAKGATVGHVLAVQANTRGYPSLHLSRVVDGKKQVSGHMIHTLVMLAFRGPMPKWAQQVNHRNGVKADPRLENLEYVTRSQNQQHAVKMGLFKLGSQRPGAKLTETQVTEMRERRRSGEKLRSLADAFGVSLGNVCCITNRRQWKHIP